jgi:hypothetical protein
MTRQRYADSDNSGDIPKVDFSDSHGSEHQPAQFFTPFSIADWASQFGATADAETALRNEVRYFESQQAALNSNKFTHKTSIRANIERAQFTCNALIALLEHTEAITRMHENTGLYIGNLQREHSKVKIELEKTQGRERLFHSLYLEAHTNLKVERQKNATT